jgi:hypothetical protein
MLPGAIITRDHPVFNEYEFRATRGSTCRQQTAGGLHAFLILSDRVGILLTLTCLSLYRESRGRIVSHSRGGACAVYNY